LIEYEWNSDYELVGLVAYTKKVKYERATIGNSEVRIIDLVAHLGVVLLDIPCVKASFCPEPQPPSQCSLSINQASQKIQARWSMEKTSTCFKVNGYKVEVADTTGKWRQAQCLSGAPTTESCDLSLSQLQKEGLQSCGLLKVRVTALLANGEVGPG
jgi:hypothetical protein